MKETDSLLIPQDASGFSLLRDQIQTHATSRDSYQLLQRLSDLQRLLQAGEDISEGWEKWIKQYNRSQSIVERRKQNMPEIRYPDLPVSERADEIAELIHNHQVVVIAGETGSGKTTQIPKICLQAGLGVRGLIGHTQPRRIAARTVASRIAEELGTQLGQGVGYQVRFSDQVSPESYIKLMTDGILLAEIQQDRFLNKYDTLIIDEAHERSLNIDFLLGYLKNLLPKRPDLKLIITSATIDVEKFSRHFNNAPVVEVSGRTYPVDIVYSDPQDLDSDKYQMIVDCLREIQGSKKQGDVLVFLSGEREIREARQAIHNARLLHTEVIPLYARLSLAEQSKIFSTHRGRRIVLSTNVAETSITVPGIRYVIDTGRARISRYSFRTKVQRLPIEAVSQASANQRAGRCGRLSDGVCYRLYSEEDFQSRSEFTDPEIVRTNLAAVILQMLHLRIGDIRNFPFIDSPDNRLINDGFKLLEELQAVTSQGKLTAIGRNLVKIPLDPRLGRMLLEASKTSALNEVMIIVSGLSIQDPRERPADKRQAADQAHQQWQDKDSDFLSLLNLWNHFEEKRQVLSRNQFGKYCHKQFVSYLRMREWRDLHHQVHSACRSLGLKENQQPADYGAIHRALLSGLLGQVGVRYEQWEFSGTRNRKFFIFPGSGLSKKPPKWVMAGAMMETTKQYALNVAKIESMWLESLAAHLVKKNYSEPFYHRRSGQVMAREKQTLFGLTIVEAKKVSYGKIAPAEARQVFIQQALVEDGYRGKGKFHRHNQQLVDELLALEARVRRRDLLAEEQVICDFYDERVSADIHNLPEFEKWRKKIEADNPRYFFLTKDYLLVRGLSADEQALFPESIAWAGIDYLLQYRFEPGHPEDGVSVNVPLALLHQLPRYLFEWLVPGMLRDKCVALVKGLPKQVRRHFVPVPDYIDEILLKVKAQDRPLTAVLAEQLLRKTGISIDSSDWREDSLDPWYQMNFLLRDEQGEIIATARSLEKLQQDFKSQINASLTEASQDHISREGITSWDFDCLEEEVSLSRGKLSIKAWPALCDHQDSVALEVKDNPWIAEQLSLRGQLRLALLKGREQVKYLNKQLLRGKELALKAAGVGGRAELVTAMIEASFQEAIFKGEGVIRTRQKFETLYEAGIGRVVTIAQNIEQVIATVLEPLHDVQKRLRGLGVAAVYAKPDIDQQIARLFSRDTIAHLSSTQASQYTRYIRAIDVRLEKLASQVNRDQQHIREIEEFSLRCNESQGAEQVLSLELVLMLRDFQWLIEEYRVSLYAQQLKTRVPISSKRLEKRWSEIEEQLVRFTM